MSIHFTSHVVHLAPSSVIHHAVHQSHFSKNDRDIRGLTAKELAVFYFADNCCSFPKLALAVFQRNPVRELRSICIDINLVDRKKHSPATLTIADVENARLGTK